MQEKAGRKLKLVLLPPPGGCCGHRRPIIIIIAFLELRICIEKFMKQNREGLLGWVEARR
jgi:hypothetical protein